MGKVSKYALALICGMQVSALWAADLPLKANTLAPLPQFDPYNGFYLGGTFGYGWDRGNLGATLPGGPADFGDLSNAPQGVMGGGYLGVGTRIPQFLSPLGLDAYLGAEGMGLIGNLSGTAATPGMIINPIGPPSGIVASTNDKWFARAVGRFGLIYQNVMFFGDAGWGWGNTGLNITCGTACMGPTGMVAAGSSIGSSSGTESGFTWGAGIEFPWFFGPNWKARFQYVQFDFGTNAACIFGCTPAVVANVGVGPVQATQRNHIDAVLGGISYKFPTP